MGVIRLPRMFGGSPRSDRIPADKWDNESDVLKSVGEWLAMLPDDQAKFRVLTYWMWRIKSGDSPTITEWVEDFAEQSAADIACRTGFDVKKRGDQ